MKVKLINTRSVDIVPDRKKVYKDNSLFKALEEGQYSGSKLDFGGLVRMQSSLLEQWKATVMY